MESVTFLHVMECRKGGYAGWQMFNIKTRKRDTPKTMSGNNIHSIGVETNRSKFGNIAEKAFSWHALGGTISQIFVQCRICACSGLLPQSAPNGPQCFPKPQEKTQINLLGVGLGPHRAQRPAIGRQPFWPGWPQILLKSMET